jgi:dipeptidase
MYIYIYIYLCALAFIIFISIRPSAIIDYGSLIWVTLQRSKTAREAISVLDDLMQTYGYASGGESFSIADQKEAWVMEIIGKGEYELGSVWVAVKVPDGSITGHANQARIQQFPLDEVQSCHPNYLRWHCWFGRL